VESDELFNLVFGRGIVKLLTLLNTEVLKQLSDWLDISNRSEVVL
jgi:hypothetical protein